MPTYDGTYKLAVEDGRTLIRDVEGGSLSTHVPLEIYSNYAAQANLTDSRQLRLRIQPEGESNVSNSYVTDMGIQNSTGNYFFITAPQNTSNVGDQNTFVISKTSNVGIGTTDPEATLQVVGDIKCQTLTATTITGGSPLTISATSIAIEAPMNIDTITVSNITHTDTVTMSADIFVTEGSVLTLSKIFHSDTVTMSANMAMDSDKTLTTSNIETSNLTVSNRLSGGTISVSNIEATANLVVGGPVDITGTLSAAGITSSAAVNVTGTISATGNILATGTANCAYDTSTTHYFGKAAIGYNNSDSNAAVFAHVSNMSDTNYALKQSLGGTTHLNRPTGTFIRFKEANVDQMTIIPGGNVGIGIEEPTEKLHIVASSNPTILIEDPDQANQARVTFRTTVTDWTIGQHGSTNVGDFKISNSDDFGTNDVVIIRKTSGNVGIGIDPPTEKLHVNGNILATGDITAFSDKRYKDDLVVIESALDKVKRLTGYTYTLHGNRSAGLLAQDVLEVLPEVVKGSEETNYSLAYGNLMGLVVEAIKDLDKKIDRILEKQ